MRETWLPLGKECIKMAVYLKLIVNLLMENTRPYVTQTEVVEEEDSSIITLA